MKLYDQKIKGQTPPGDDRPKPNKKIGPAVPEPLPPVEESPAIEPNERVNPSSSTTYQYRDVEKRRAYLREYQRKYMQEYRRKQKQIKEAP